MRRIVFIIRDGFDAEFMCSNLRLDSSKYEVIFILESGKKARQKKIKRMLNKSNFFAACMNMVALLLYDRVMMQNMKKILGNYKYPSGKKYFHIVDVNDEECLNICGKIKPELIMIYGTGILTSQTIENLGVDIFNIHSSILPYYRNVHSDFWAYMEGKFDKIGITIFKLSEGIDTGYIADQIVSVISGTAKLYEYKVKNLENIIVLVDRFIDNYFHEGISLKAQDDSVSSISRTPKTKDIISFFKKKK